ISTPERPAYKTQLSNSAGSIVLTDDASYLALYAELGVSISPSLLLKLECAVFGVNVNGLAFVKFAFEDVETERVQNFFLNCALERARAINRIVAFAREQFLRRIGKIERNLLLLESFRQASELNLDDFL